MTFFRGKTVFFHSEAKKGKKKQPKKKKKTHTHTHKTNKQKTNKKNKEGLGPSEVALRATSPDL